MANVVATVQACLAIHGVAPDASVAVACSGGPDSTALADAAARARGGRRLELVYVDHGLRAETEADIAQVAALAAALGAGTQVLRVRVESGRASLEDAARRARYAALDQLAAEWVLTGHTASDQAETVLMRIVRGTGIAGLAGIPVRRGRYLRPLLSVSRVEVEAYLAERALATRRDPMNDDPRFTRNRARARWLPALAGENPAIERALVTLAASAREQRDVLEVAADAFRGADAVALAAAPSAVAKRVLQRAAQAAGLGPLGAAHLDALRAAVTAPPAGTVTYDLPGGRFIREYHNLRFECRAGTVGDAPPPEVQGPDAPYITRRWRAGDRMRPARLRGRSRKLSDLFADGRVPRECRSFAWIVVRARDGAIVWAEHVGPAHGVEVSVTLTPKVAVATNVR